MEKLVWCLAVVVALSGCVTPSRRYAALKEESLQARTLEEAVKASPLRRVKVGREIKLRLDKPDEILLTSDGAYSDSYYVSYYQLYAFEVVAGKSYSLTVKSFCDCLGFQKLMPVPEAYVVDGEGRLISRMIQPVHQEGFNGGLEGKWGFAAEENGEYFLVLAADNSDPGQVVGEVVGWAYNPISKSSYELKLPLQSSTTGSMAFEVNEI